MSSILTYRHGKSPPEPKGVKTKYWHKLSDGRVQCDLCPRQCKLRDGQQGLCFVRVCDRGEIRLTTYGRSSGFCIDPIEKKPLNHFLPGTPVLSFGTAGCNLACKFCQNWDVSKSREMHTLADAASPEQLAIAAEQNHCESIAFTYNDPIIFHEYAIDVAQSAKEKNISSVAVTAGYVLAEPRHEFFSSMDAANVDLKAFTERFYHKICGGHLNYVLDTLLFLKHETSVWFELTTLLIPGENDSAKEIDEMTRWIYDNLGSEVPLHFSAFHPDYRMLDVEETSASILHRSRDIAKANGLSYVYTGNIHDANGGSTYCPNCEQLLIERDWYELGIWHLDVPEEGGSGFCRKCNANVAGVFKPAPGNWGRKRQLVKMS